MRVREVIEKVQEWVDLYARHVPGFAGAYLWGGITALPGDATFPLYRDVDVAVLLPAGAQEDTVETLYRGIMLEVIRLDVAEHRDAEAVLANPSQGPNLATTQILADPDGILVPLQRAVAKEYGRRRWIAARCEAEKTSAEKQLATMRAASIPFERLDALRSYLGALSGLLAVAQLGRPTTRRTLALLGELLDAAGRPDLHEEALQLMGSAGMTRADVERMLERWAAAFDRSVEVRRTPTPYGFANQRHLRPYYVQGAQEMIDEGKHRDAVFWIALLDEPYLVLQNDAPDVEKPAFAAQLQAMLDALGYTSEETWAERLNWAEQLAHEVYGIADGLVAQYPD